MFYTFYTIAQLETCLKTDTQNEQNNAISIIYIQRVETPSIVPTGPNMRV